MSGFAVPSEPPPDFRLNAVTIDAAQVLQRLLEEDKDPVPEWVRQAAEGVDPTSDPSDMPDDREEPPGDVPGSRGENRFRALDLMAGESAEEGAIELRDVLAKLGSDRSAELIRILDEPVEISSIATRLGRGELAPSLDEQERRVISHALVTAQFGRLYGEVDHEVLTRRPSDQAVGDGLLPGGYAVVHPDGAAASDGPWLTAGEAQVLRLLATDLSLGQIAEELSVSRSTVKSHVVSVYRKLNTGSRADALARARELGFLDDDWDDVATALERAAAELDDEAARRRA
jgi:DNA-binding CsgD family transcriptional regulator